MTYYKQHATTLLPKQAQSTPSKTTTVSPPRSQQSSMADDATRALICLITGESTVFKVQPNRRDDIMDLKELIKGEGKNGVLNSVLAKYLILWKVRTTMASDSSTN
jgi:Crinkler effector protein N-terminal domain